MRRFVGAALAALLYLALPAPASANWLSRAFPDLFPPDEEDLNEMAAEAYERAKATERLVEWGPAYEAVRRVGRRIAEVSGRPDYDWEFVLIDSPVANAWAMPGGKVAVYTGILPVVENEAGLAAVMGHEIAHAVERHTLERLEEMRPVVLANLAANIATRHSSKRDEWMTAIGGISTVGILFPYSRRQEADADEAGLMLMARAGYDPREAPRIWARMVEEGGRRPPEFLSTHPDPGRREARLRAMLPEAIDEYERAPHRWGADPIPLEERWRRRDEWDRDPHRDDLQGEDPGEGFSIRIRF